MSFDPTTAKPVGRFDPSTATPVDPSADQSGYIAQTLKNVPRSAGNFVKGIYEAVRHPIDTVENLGALGEGAVQHALPQSWQAESASGARDKASAVADFYKQRYGGADRFAEAVKSDPVGVLADISTVVTGGGTLAAKIPGLLKAGEAVANAGKAMSPLNAAGAALKPVANLAGKTGANVIGGVGTHTGAESIKGAFTAGEQGGAKADAFLANMRGDVPKTDVLEQARNAVDQMKQDRSAAYRGGMVDISKDKTMLDFKAIDQAVSDAADAVSFKGQVKNVKAAKAVQEMSDAVEHWKSLDPTEFHTPEGLDALKQKLGGIVEGIPFEEKTARLVGSKVYNATKRTIADQAPAYEQVMGDYSKASDLVKEIEKSLTGTDRTAADTAMRKLQSLMRNNANTNYGNRLDLAKKLEGAGATTLMPSLAGQSLSSWTPRGLGSTMTSIGTGGGLGWLAGGAPGAAAGLAMQSPRLMGEGTYYLGKAAGGLKAANATIAQQIDPGVLANLLYQLDQKRYQ